MVNNLPARKLVLPTKPTDSNHRDIPDGPIYDLAAVKQIIHSAIEVGTRPVWLSESAEHSTLNEFPIAWEPIEVARFILALTEVDYDKSEWAQTGSQMWVDCDVYTMNYSRSRQARAERGPTLYAKFGVARFTPTCLVVRFHPSR